MFATWQAGKQALLLAKWLGKADPQKECGFTHLRSTALGEEGAPPACWLGKKEK